MNVLLKRPVNVLFIPISVLLSYNEYLVNGLQELGAFVYFDRSDVLLGGLMFILERMQGRLKAKLLPTYALPGALRNTYLKNLLKELLLI